MAMNQGLIRDKLDLLERSITDCKERTAKLDLAMHVHRRDQAPLHSLLDNHPFKSRHVLAGPGAAPRELPADERDDWKMQILLCICRIPTSMWLVRFLGLLA